MNEKLKCFYFSARFASCETENSFLTARHSPSKEGGKLENFPSRVSSPKFLFLNKCFSHRSYCGCVQKTPAVVLRVSQAAAAKTSQDWRKLFLTRSCCGKLFAFPPWFSLGMRDGSERPCGRWFPFRRSVVYDGSLHPLHVMGLGNKLMMGMDGDEIFVWIFPAPKGALKPLWLERNRW